MIARPLRVVAIVVFAGGLGGCASEGGPGGRGPGPTRPLSNVFVSPEGEPFRAPADAPYPSAVWFNRADTNHDGKLTAREFRQDAVNFFRQLDQNHDGIIDGGELAHYEDDIAPEILPNLGRLNAGEGMDPGLAFGRDNDGERRAHYRQPNQPRDATDVGLQGAGYYGLMNEPEPVAAADTQFDGRITLQEFMQAADNRFQMLDKTGRGYLTLPTLPKTPVQQENERRAKVRAHMKGGQPRNDGPPVPDAGAGS